MNVEIEAKFLNQNHNEIRYKLSKLGAVCKYKMKLTRRIVFDYPDRRLLAMRAWIRLREELNGSIQLVFKRVADNSLGNTFEQSLDVDNYESARDFLLALGLEIKGEQESKREVWVHEESKTEIMLDEWPWVKPFIEIEANSKNAVKSFSKKLDLNWREACFGGITPVYVAEYDITPEQFEATDFSMSFNTPIPTFLVPR